jgi:transcriptional regulator with XRE-family HTH domain
VTDTTAIAPSWKGRELVRYRFGKRLKEVRLAKGYTQDRLGRTAKRNRSFISDLERGVKEPTISTIDMLASEFSMTISELLVGV